MKREILFRGFHECENGTQIAVVNGKEYRGEWVEGCHVYDYAVIPETVCQYTGLTDKNGKRIFEGDIVKARINTDYYICKFEDCAFRIEDEYGNRILMKQEAITHMDVEVIGTIFDKEE